jgi:hypothetical protein
MLHFQRPRHWVCEKTSRTKHDQYGPVRPPPHGFHFHESNDAVEPVCVPLPVEDRRIYYKIAYVGERLFFVANL